MAAICSFLFFPNFISASHKKPLKDVFATYAFVPCSHFHHSSKRIFKLPEVASIPYPPINVDYLENEFSGHGVTFEDINDSCVLRMQLENGSFASLMLPSGLITSYKAPMWHGGKLELLHTLVSQAETRDGDAVIQGGVSLSFTCICDEVAWTPTTWALHDVRGNHQETIEVELVSRNSENMVEFRHIVTLQEDQLSSEVVVSNSNPSSLQLLGSVVSHLTVSTPEASYAIGLEGSDFFGRPPVSSNFSIIPPNFRKRGLDSRKAWSPIAIKELLSSWGARNLAKNNDTENVETQDEGDLDGEEDDNYKHLTEEMSRIYTSAPRHFTIIDRGKRNSIVVGRDGFNEVYLFSPGSAHEWYGKYAYICVGQSALLEPLNLDPNGVWRGSQHLHNPNL